MLGGLDFHSIAVAVKRAFTSIVVGAPEIQDGRVLMADSSHGSGMRWDGSLRKNYLINGDFHRWLRGTSFGSAGYAADRWYMFRETGSAGQTVSQQSHGISAVAGSGIRVQRDSGNALLTNVWIVQAIESVDSVPFQGKTVTLSFRAKRGANFSATGNLMRPYIGSGTGSNQGPSAGWTGQVDNFGSVVLSTSYERFTYTATIPANATQVKFAFSFTPTGAAGADDWFEVAGVRLQVGSVAPEYEPEAYREVEWQCLRWARHVGAHAHGKVDSASTVVFGGPLSPPMRVAPTASVIDTSITVRTSASDTTSAGSAIAFSTTKADSWLAGMDGFAGLTAGQAAPERSGDNFLLLTAEL